MRDQAGKNGESQEAKAEGRTGEATVRRKREERKGRNSGLSSRKWNGSGRKEANGKRKISKEKHLRNSCGKRIREGRKETYGEAEYRNRDRKHGKPGRRERGRPQERK